MTTPNSVTARSTAISAAILAGVVLAALSGCAGTAIRKTDLYRSYYDEPIPSPPSGITYERVNGTHVFRLSGDEYSMGFRYGEKAAELGIARIYGEIFDNAAAMLRDDAPDDYRGHITVKVVKELLVEAWSRMEPFTPAYAVRMLEGFADGSGIPIADVQAMHAIPDFTETSCSALWASGSATLDGSAVQIRVLDYIMGLGIQKYPAVVFMAFDQGHTVANVGWLGLLGVISGMNDAGLGVSEMGYGDVPGEHFRGIPMPFLLLDILRWSDNPREASGIIRSNPRTNSYVYIVGSAREGGIVFITNPYSVESFTPGQADAPVPQLPDMLHAGHYQERMDALVAERHGTISIDWLRDEFIPAIAMDSNLQNVIYDLENLKFSVANAPNREQRAAEAEYTMFTFPE